MQVTSVPLQEVFLLTRLRNTLKISEQKNTNANTLRRVNTKRKASAIHPTTDFIGRGFLARCYNPFSEIAINTRWRLCNFKLLYCFSACFFNIIVIVLGLCIPQLIILTCYLVYTAHPKYLSHCKSIHTILLPTYRL